MKLKSIQLKDLLRSNALPEPDTAVMVDDVVVGIVSSVIDDSVQLDINPQYQKLVDRVVKSLNTSPEGLPMEIPHA